MTSKLRTTIDNNRADKARHADAPFIPEVPVEDIRGLPPGSLLPSPEKDRAKAVAAHAATVASLLKAHDNGMARADFVAGVGEFAVHPLTGYNERELMVFEVISLHRNDEQSRANAVVILRRAKERLDTLASNLLTMAPRTPDAMQLANLKRQEREKLGDFSISGERRG